MMSSKMDDGRTMRCNERKKVEDRERGQKKEIGITGLKMRCTVRFASDGTIVDINKC